MSYQAHTELDAVSQKLYLAVIDDSGAEHPEYGKIELALGDLRTIKSAAGTITLLDSSKPATAISFVEVAFCNDAGDKYYGIMPVGGFYTKS